MFWIWVLIAIVLMTGLSVLLSHRRSGRTLDRSTGPDSATRGAYEDSVRRAQTRGGPDAP